MTSLSTAPTPQPLTAEDWLNAVKRTPASHGSWRRFARWIAAHPSLDPQHLTFSVPAAQIRRVLEVQSSTQADNILGRMIAAGWLVKLRPGEPPEGLRVFQLTIPPQSRRSTR